MKPEIKRLWLKALRSGKYKQGKGVLRHNDAYCCLGVLCDIYAKRKHARWQKGSIGGIYTLFGQLTTLPGCVMEWAGFDLNPSVADYTLARRNDNGASFKEIADLIEEHL